MSPAFLGGGQHLGGVCGNFYSESQGIKNAPQRQDHLTQDWIGIGRGGGRFESFHHVAV
jgi:hypothetical protein